MKNAFKCKNEKKFLSLKKVCDGEMNCFYGSDELLCGPTASALYFQWKFCTVSRFIIFKCQNERKSVDEQKIVIELKSSNLKRMEFSLENLEIKCLDIQSKVTILLIFNQRNVDVKYLSFCFPNLISLILMKNHIKETEKLALKFSILQYLDLRKNFLKNLQILNYFVKSRLIYLDISDNNFNSINSIINQFPSLRVLKMTKLTLFHTEKLAFHSLANLRELHLNKSEFSFTVNWNFEKI